MAADPTLPDVPNAEGVPSVKRNPDAQTDTTESQLTEDSLSVTAIGKNQWGIYTSENQIALECDTVLSIGFDAEYRIADYPLQDGTFETYDKVAMPFNARVVMAKGGTREDRRDFISTLEDMRADMKLYNVVVPERAYLNVNIAHVSIDRSREQGAGMITAEIVLREIRVNATATFTKTKEPASAATASNGNAQASATTTLTDGVQ
jgi:hypothetical protein